MLAIPLSCEPSHEMTVNNVISSQVCNFSSQERRDGQSSDLSFSDQDTSEHESSQMTDWQILYYTDILYHMLLFVSVAADGQVS